MAAAVDRPIFVVGCGRSGTTLLYEVLAEHPALAWISNYTERAPWFPALAELNRLPLRRPEKGEGRLSRLRPHPVEGYALWDRTIGPLPHGSNAPAGAQDVTPRAAADLRAVVSSHCRHQHRPRFVNKNTRNATRVPYLLAVFPDADIVHVVRHPRAVARSLSRVAFWPDVPVWWADGRAVRDLIEPDRSSLALAAEFWAHEVGLTRQGMAALPKEQRHEVHYEELLERPHQVVSALLEGLGLDVARPVIRALDRVKPIVGSSLYDPFPDLADEEALRRFASREAGDLGYDLAGR